MATKVIDKIVRNVPELSSPHEGAGMSLVLHAAEAAKAGPKRLVVLSAVLLEGAWEKKVSMSYDYRLLDVTPQSIN